MTKAQLFEENKQLILNAVYTFVTNRSINASRLTRMNISEESIRKTFVALPNPNGELLVNALRQVNMEKVNFGVKSINELFSYCILLQRLNVDFSKVNYEMFNNYYSQTDSKTIMADHLFPNTKYRQQYFKTKLPTLELGIYEEAPLNSLSLLYAMSKSELSKYFYQTKINDYKVCLTYDYLITLLKNNTDLLVDGENTANDIIRYYLKNYESECVNKVALCVENHWKFSEAIVFINHIGMKSLNKIHPDLLTFNLKPYLKQANLTGENYISNKYGSTILKYVTYTGSNKHLFKLVENLNAQDKLTLSAKIILKTFVNCELNISTDLDHVKNFVMKYFNIPSMHVLLIQNLGVDTLFIIGKLFRITNNPKIIELINLIYTLHTHDNLLFEDRSLNLAYLSNNTMNKPQNNITSKIKLIDCEDTIYGFKLLIYLFLINHKVLNQDLNNYIAKIHYTSQIMKDTNELLVKLINGYTIPQVITNKHLHLTREETILLRILYEVQE